MKALLAGLLLAGTAGAASAADSWHLDHVTIKGSQSVPASELYPALQERPGTTVTKDEILADQDALAAALQKHHVVGNISTALVDKHNGHVDVVFTLADQGVQAPVTTATAPTLGQQIFNGNKRIDTPTLTQTSGLQPGEKLTEKTLQDALSAIGALYKQKNIGVNIQPQIAQNGAVVTVTWNITEAKQKKKKRDTEDLGGFSTDQ